MTRNEPIIPPKPIPVGTVPKRFLDSLVWLKVNRVSNADWITTGKKGVGCNLTGGDRLGRVVVENAYAVHKHST